MIITRFAPSPTGYLHIGGLRTALFSYLWAKKNNGKFVLRIEDTDKSRNSKEAAQKIIEAFNWVGLKYDGEITYQSQRDEIYNKYINQLLDEGKAYYCYMSKDELADLRAKQEANKERPRYNGKYRDFDGTPPEGIEPVIRIKAPQSGTISFNDGIKGDMKFNAEDVLDDFIIARADKSPTYNFVVAIDDALMGINDVIRGDDHLNNTPKQIVVYEALGFELPKFYHVPMIHNESGKKLSKRDGATDVMQYKTDGFLPEALLNFLVRLGWSHKDQEIFSFEEMEELFDPKNINKSASIYNTEKLVWLNGHYLKNLTNQELANKLEYFNIFITNHDKLEILLDATKERAKTLKDLAEAIKNIIDTPIQYEPKSVKKHLKEPNIQLLEQFYEALKIDTNSFHIPADYENIAKPILEKNEAGMPKLAQPIRIAMVGSAQSPSVYDVMAALGKDEVLKRIDTLLNYIKGK